MASTEDRVKAPLALLRDFVGSRLEQQALIRADELAVPCERRAIGTPVGEQSDLQRVQAVPSLRRPRRLAIGA